jgi:hypothetical protein
LAAWLSAAEAPSTRSARTAENAAAERRSLILGLAARVTDALTEPNHAASGASFRSNNCPPAAAIAPNKPSDRADINLPVKHCAAREVVETADAAVSPFKVSHHTHTAFGVSRTPLIFRSSHRALMRPDFWCRSEAIVTFSTRLAARNVATNALALRSR